jgi:hypothetical protein
MPAMFNDQKTVIIRLSIITILTYAGTIPFIIAALYPEGMIRNISAITIVSSYAAAIISFISGIHWSLYMTENKPERSTFLIITNIITLSGLALLLFATSVIAIGGYLGLFSSLLVVDAHAARSGAISNHFRRLRLITTVIVCISLTTLLLRLICAL